MQRTEYLELCQKCAVMTKGIGSIIENISDELIVEYDNIKYYPYAYKLSFDTQGKPQHTAVLHSLVANAITNAKLERVKRYERKQEN